MKSLLNLSRVATTVVVASAVLSGCAINMKVPVKDPAPSVTTFKTPAGKAPVSLAFKDERSEENKARVVSGLIPMHVVYEDKPFDPVPWLARHTVKELAARGLPSPSATAAAAAPPCRSSACRSRTIAPAASRRS